jgi:hypothetical protein
MTILATRWFLRFFTRLHSDGLEAFERIFSHFFLFDIGWLSLQADCYILCGGCVWAITHIKTKDYDDWPHGGMTVKFMKK